MSVIDGMVKEGQLTPEQAERARRSAEGLLKAASSGDTGALEELEKMAGLAKGIMSGFKGNLRGAMESTLPQVAVTALAMSGIGAATGAMKDVYQSLKGRITEHTNYQGMLEKNPSLRNHPNQELVHDTFKTLHRFNPSYAKDPLVAGTFVQNAVDMERMDVSNVNALVQAAKNIQDTKPKGQDYPGLMARFHQSPEQRMMAMNAMQRDRWGEEDRPINQQQLRDNAAAAASRVEEQGFKADQAMYGADTAQSRAAEAAEAAAAETARREFYEVAADMASDARTNKDYEALIAAMRPKP